MVSFKDDYSEGCHPRILEALATTNLVQQLGYGDDSYSLEAKSLIRSRIENSSADIYFVSGGTQANLISISASLRPHESVISAYSGHIQMHEAGAIEATGHKVNSLHTEDGKLCAADIQKVLTEHSDVPHMVKPKMVYISNPTEVGTIYSKSELASLSSFCKSNDLYLYLDGARLGSALMASLNDISLADLAQLVDLFYIGGTKNGALLGEAIIITNNQIKNDFAYIIKQRGGLLAKGRVVGIQFLELFRDNLYFDLAAHANNSARKLTSIISAKGYTFLTSSETNQLFPIFPNRVVAELANSFDFYKWQVVDSEHTAIRLVTSWATTDENISKFEKVLGELVN